jgi:hypothetical protein
MDGELSQVLVQCTTSQRLPCVLDQVTTHLHRHIKLRKEVVNINNIPALTDIKPNYGVYGKVRVLEHDKAKQFENLAERESTAPANRGKALTMMNTTDIQKKAEDPTR